MPTSTTLPTNRLKTSTNTGVKQEQVTIKPSNAASTIMPQHPTNSTIQHVQVPTPILQPVVSVNAHKPVPVIQTVKAPAARAVVSRTTVVHPAVTVQRGMKPSSPKSKKKKTTVSMATAQSAQSSTQGENTGRWTAEEHRLFLQGLEQHGKGWKKIASLIKSRTVVQIRTHAQKYFQKLAKARQNGEQGEVSMENRERVVISNSTKRRKSGTKRKAIASVVASAERENKKISIEKATKSKSQEKAVELSLPVVAPALAPYIYPMGAPPNLIAHVSGSDGQITPTETVPGTTHLTTVPSITTAHGTISGAALEDSLFRFLTPMPEEPNLNQGPSGHVNDVARQAGANPITVPTGAKSAQPQFSGDVSPTGVVDFPSDWAWTNETPSWYSKGADVDELLNEAEALDWLADSGDLQEAYDPPPPDQSRMSEPSLLSLVEPVLEVKVKTAPAPTITALDPIQPPHVPILETSSNVAHMTPTNSSGNMPRLPCLFYSNNNLSEMKAEKSTNLSSTSLFASSAEEADVGIAGNLLVEDPMDEHAFVTSLLDSTNDSMGNLNHLGH